MAIKNLLKKIKHKIFKDSSNDLYKYYYKCLDMPIEEKMVLYEAFAGMGALDNQRAIFKAFLELEKEDDYYKGFTHVFSVDNPKMMEENIKEFKKVRNVKFLKRGGKEYMKTLATAKYLINNSAFMYCFTKRDEQIFIETWHGIPTKYMGYEHTKERVENARGIIRCLLNADYVLSANNFMTERMYKKAYLADGVTSAEYILDGYPRNDALVNTNREYVLEKLKNAGLDTSKKIVLYAPTWKGVLFDKLSYNLDEFRNIVLSLKESVSDEYNVYLRVHYFIYKELKDDEVLKDILVPFTIDTNELLSVTDILISDYSSIFFDFIRRKKPIIFYVPDLNEYVSGRGLYVPVETLPGAVHSDLSDVCNVLAALIGHMDEYMDYYKDKYNRMIYWCSKLCKEEGIEPLIDEEFEIPEDDINKEISDGECSKRLIRKIFAKGSAPYHIETPQDKKEHVLYFIDYNDAGYEGLEKLKDEVTATDFSKCDVTILTYVFKNNIAMKNFFQRMIPKEVRILCYTNLPFDISEDETLTKRDIVRNLGKVKFDKVVEITELPKGWKKEYIMR